MPDLSTHYMGLSLKNPLIAGSSGLTAQIDTIKELAIQGVGAVVLKSVFEEDLVCNSDKQKTFSQYPKSLKQHEHVGTWSRHVNMTEYLRLIERCKQEVDIPIIASINCVSSFEWMSFARRIESSGADALELNFFVPPSDPMKSSEDIEKVYFDVLTELMRVVKLPLAVKISPYFSGMTKMALKLSWTGIAGMVLFNRYYVPDIDIDTIKVIHGPKLSHPEEIYLPLRWTALLSDRVMCDIAAATGVHDSQGMIKMILAGAKAVQVTSAFYKNGPAYANLMLKGLEAWMTEHEFDSIKSFCGKLSLKKSDNPATYERFQYLSNFGGFENDES
ncbi:MAG: dihydroorotate dehydrogenase-like protein [Bacteroidota bacterium]